MAYLEKIVRMMKLTGILALAAGATLVSACRGKTPNNASDLDAARQDAAVPDGGIDGSVMPDGTTADAALVDSGLEDAQPVDAQLWDVICE